MKKKELKAIQDLKSNISRARETGSFKRASDLNLELAQFLRSIDENEAAVAEFQNVVDLAKKAHVRADEILALRGIAEIRSENGEQEQCLKFMNMYEQLVKSDPTEYQLMLTVGSYCFIKLYTVDERNDTLLEQAREYAERSLKLLDTEEMDQAKMLQGDKISIRKCNCHRMIAEIAGYQNNREVGERHSKAAFDIADLKNQFEIMRARIDFPWRDRVKAAEDLCKLADSSMKTKRLEAHLFLAQTFFEQQQIEKGAQTLLDIYEVSNTRCSGISDEDRGRYSELLIFAYRARIRMTLLNKCEEEKDRAGQYVTCDKLADLYNNAGFKKAALHYYKAAINLSESEEQKRAALVSCAETAADLKLYMVAAGYFERVLTIEDKMDMDTSETRASLFEMRLFGKEFNSDSDVNLAVDELEKYMKSKNFLIAVYNATARYYEKKGNKSDTMRFRMLEDSFMKEFMHAECNDDVQEGLDNMDSLDEMSDEEILQVMRGEANEKAKRKALAKAGRKENQYGETKLIERAREGKLEDVKILISQGADVNKADPVGWTPLSEAVGANKIEIVKLLLTKGANPNSQSKDGWIDTHFGGKITPLMEACTNGYHEIAAWLLNHPSSSTLVTSTNLDGWSSADFMSDYIKRSRRGSESEAEFQRHLDNCTKVLEKMKQMQRKQGFPIRSGDPPDPRPKSDDTPQFAAEKEKASRRARINEKRKGAADDYQEAISSIGSRSRQAEKENQTKAKKRYNDLFDEDDEEYADASLVNTLSSANRANYKRDPSAAIELSSDSGEESMEVGHENTTLKGDRKSLDLCNDFNFELDIVSTPRSSQSTKEFGAGQPKKVRVCGIQKMLQKKKGQKRSVEFGDENGVSIVPDIFAIEERCAPKRKRNESESSQSEAGSIISTVKNIDRRDSLGNAMELSYYDNHSPNGMYRTESRSSLSSASALVSTTVKVIIETPGVGTNLTVLSKAPSNTDISDLPKHIEKLRNAINGSNCEWLFGGDVIESMALSDLADLTDQKVIEIHCRIEKSVQGEFERRCDASDLKTNLSMALRTFEISRPASLVISDGFIYSKKTRDALWRAIEAHSLEKTREDAQWRTQIVKIEKFRVPSFALRALIRMRPREILSLRYCEIDDSKIEEMIDEMNSSDITTLQCDLSFNDLISPGQSVAKMMKKMKVNTLILQGLSGVVQGCDLMTHLRGIPLNCLVLDENPWLDDSCMQELMKGDSICRLTTLKVSKCAIRTMTWMEGQDGLKLLKNLSLAENNCIVASGWDRVAEFVRSPGCALQKMDISGTAVRSVILDALAARSSDAPLLSVTITKCNGITPSEICRAFGPIIHDERSPISFKLLLEEEKVEEVRATAPLIASKVLKIFPK